MHLIKILWIPSVRVLLGVVVRGRRLGLRGAGGDDLGGGDDREKRR